MTIARIKELLKRFNPQASDADIEELAKALDSSGARPTGAAISKEELEQRKKFLESIGETNRARQEELDYIEAEIAKTSQGAFKGISDTVKTLQAGGGGLSLLDNLVSDQGIQRLMAQKVNTKVNTCSVFSGMWS